MRRKGIFTLLTATCMVLAFAAMSFAANQVFLKTTVPNIPKSTCYQAGSTTMEMDNGTTIREGDVIQFTLNNKVTACKNLNLFLVLGSGDISTSNGSLSADATLPVSASDAANVLDYSVALGAAENRMGFVVRATDADTPAGQIITMTLRQIDADGVLVGLNTNRLVTFDTSAATTPDDDKLVIKLFDNKTTAGAWFKLDADGDYDAAIVTGDNVLCIDTLTQDFPDEYVQETPDSIPSNPAERLNFSGDYRIAHILAEQAYSLFACKNATPGHIVLGKTDQDTDSCVSFDFETTAGYCTDHKASRFVLKASQPFEVTDYIVKMEILVNGIPGANGVYWSSVAPSFGHFATTTTTGGACASDASIGPFADQDYFLANGDDATPVAINPGCAGVDDDAKAVTIVTDPTALFVFGDSYLYINFPPFNYNLAEVHSGDAVSVKVTISKSTCGVVTTQTIPIGVFGCVVTPPTLGSTLRFPYFTSLSADAFWNGIAIINTSSAGGTAKLTAHEKDGTVCESPVITVAAGSMFVDLLENISWNKTSGSGVCSGANNQSWISVLSTDFNGMDGFGMIANEVSGESMGYLPRKPEGQ